MGAKDVNVVDDDDDVKRVQQNAGMDEDPFYGQIRLKLWPRKMDEKKPFIRCDNNLGLTEMYSRDM